jgi:acyl-CoA thioesterase I
LFGSAERWVYDRDSRGPLRRGDFVRNFLLLLLTVCGLANPSPTRAQTRILPLGDSITHGGQGYVSYRYDLWFALGAAGYSVEFVGQQSALFNNDAPIAAFYPNYFTTFDRDHEGHWGWRTDMIAAIVDAVAADTTPDIALIHLGSNDVGQSGAAGVANADAYLREIIGRLRLANPNIDIALAQIVPIGPGTSYFANADHIPVLNAAIATIASDLDSANSRVLLVDQFSGFDLATMMQSDGLHPDREGELFMAGRWQAALAGVLVPANLPPSVSLTSPNAGASFIAPADILLTASAGDPDGVIAQVIFRANGSTIAIDAAPPFEFNWQVVAAGDYNLTAIATDDGGATRESLPVAITVAPAGSVWLAIANPSFETPALSDGALAQGPGDIGGWQFSGTSLTYTGIFNPPSGSYPAAGGNGTPTGAEGANAAYLFNNGGASESVALSQTLSAVLAAETDYELKVAIGRFLPSQPYDFSLYGGYRIELLAGGSVIATGSDAVLPAVGAFADATATVAAADIPAALIGQPLTVRCTISDNVEDRSTHFDHVRLRATPRPCPGDVTGDGQVGLDDLARLLSNFGTIGGATRQDGDLNGDTNVDLADLAALLERFGAQC